MSIAQVNVCQDLHSSPAQPPPPLEGINKYLSLSNLQSFRQPTGFPLQTLGGDPWLLLQISLLDFYLVSLILLNSLVTLSSGSTSPGSRLCTLSFQGLPTLLSVPTACMCLSGPFWNFWSNAAGPWLKFPCWKSTGRGVYKGMGI